MTCSRNAQDLKVLLVGFIFTVLIYTGVSALEVVDLVLHK